MHPQKQDIRRRILKQRFALTPSQVQEVGDAVRNRLVETNLYGRARCLGCYVSVKNEVDTHRLIQVALEGGKRVGVPVTRKKRPLVHLEIHTLFCLRSGPFGLLEPAEGDRIEIPPGDFDLILVPGVAFDRRGNRIGFGAGYYDRFLARTSAPKVGLAYAFQVLDRLPAALHDIRLDYLVTETAIHTCGSPYL